MPNPGPEALDRGTHVVGANHAVFRERRRLFPRQPDS
jgi:hypothetical protein